VNIRATRDLLGRTRDAMIIRFPWELRNTKLNHDGNPPFTIPAIMSIFGPPLLQKNKGVVEKAYRGIWPYTIDNGPN